MNLKIEKALGAFLVMVHNAAERVTGIPVEYVSFTVKLQDRPPISATRRSGIYDRTPQPNGREDDEHLEWEWGEEAEEAGAGGDDHSSRSSLGIRRDAGAGHPGAA